MTLPLGLVLLLHSFGLDKDSPEDSVFFRISVEMVVFTSVGGYEVLLVFIELESQVRLI